MQNFEGALADLIYAWKDKANIGEMLTALELQIDLLSDDADMQKRQGDDE